MARRRCPVTQETVKRLLKGADAAGVAVRIEIEPTGKVVVLPVGNGPTPDEPPERGEIIL